MKKRIMSIMQFVNGGWKNRVKEYLSGKGAGTGEQKE